MPKTARGTANITINSADDIEITLEVDYVAHAGSRDHYDPNYGWSQGEPAGVEIDGEIGCMSIGDITIPVVCQLEMGDAVYEQFMERVQEAVEREANEAAAERCDP